MKNSLLPEEHVLGLDIGANSVGWALVAVKDGQPMRLVRAGVRVFAAGVEGDIGAIESGRDVSRAVARREARLRRRMLERRRRRLNKLAMLLQQGGLLPPGDISSAAARMTFFADLDRSLFPQDLRRSHPHVLPYRLRARALDEKLSPCEIGRALYHLAQRRGFLPAGRVKAGRGGEEEQKEQGQVEKGIGKLEERMRESGARTLGEYLSGLDPDEQRIRGPGHWTARGMFEDEFEKVWAAQTPRYPEILTEELKKRVHRAIFFQRPLKTQRHLVGECELEPGRKRAPIALPSAQRFRFVQKVNDLEIITPDGERRKPTPEQRETLVSALETQGDLEFKKVRKLLSLSKEHSFNHEHGGDKKLIGNRTASGLGQIFGDRWRTLSAEQRDRVVEDVRSMHNRDALKRRAMRVWGLDEHEAERLASLPLEDGHCSLSRKALEKVLPAMERGVRYATARNEVYGERPRPPTAAFLPPLDRAVEVRNPAVERALTEVRKVVNAIVREHAKPALIRIELARDLKKSRPDRKRIAEGNRERETARNRAAEEICKEAGIAKPRASDIEKYLLAEECSWQCPYTGKQINWDTLFGDSPQFDVEHIIPLQRCLDNSFVNKTLCDLEENRKRKGNRTPWEAYGADPQRWEEMIRRVRGFRSWAARAKLQRFQMKDLESLDDFATRQLNDTRYASRRAVEFVGLLYGSGADGVDPKGTRRIQASRGQVTRFLRDEWRLNAVLGGGEKRREDHRHHAIDAVVVALTEPGTIKRLSDAAARARLERRRRFGKMPDPWSGFLDEVRAAIERLIVSHRVSRKVSGAMHEETIYSKPRTGPDGKECVHVRKPVGGLSKQDLENIVDPIVRDCVLAKLEELGGGEASRAFSDPKKHPSLAARDGRQVPIHKVRVRVSAGTTSVGEGARERHVILGNNHHVEVLETKDAKGRAKWEGFVVSMYEAMRRLKAKEPVIRRDHGPEKKFLFSLAGGETIEIDEHDGTRGLYVVRTVATGRSGQREYPAIEFARLNDARKKEDIKKAGAWKKALVDPLRRAQCQKVTITPLGEVRRASD